MNKPPGTYLRIENVLLRQTPTVGAQPLEGRRSPGRRSTSPSWASAARRPRPAGAHPAQADTIPEAIPGPSDLNGTGPRSPPAALPASPPWALIRGQQPGVDRHQQPLVRGTHRLTFSPAVPGVELSWPSARTQERRPRTRLMASERVAALRMMPRTAEVTVLDPGLRTPRMDMHRCSASTTTSTPRQPTPSPTLLGLDKVK